MISTTTTATRRLLQSSLQSIKKSTRRSIMSSSAKMEASALSTTNAQRKLIQYSIITTGLITFLTTVMPTPADNTKNVVAKNHDNRTLCEIIMLGPTKEKSTGILFPQLCNAMQFVGCGVRVKYGFVKVYAVGTYMDPMSMSAVKSQGYKAVSEALLNPAYPRTIRIVMNRSLSIDKYTAAIVEALEPRMNGEDLDKLEEFKKLNPPIDLIEGAEMEMTIRGNTMLYKNSVGGIGQIESHVFCKALCDVYYGKEAVSPGHKEEVVKGVLAM